MKSMTGFWPSLRRRTKLYPARNLCRPSWGKMERARRRQNLRRIALLVALGVLSAWIMPSVLATTATVVNAVGEQSQSFGLLIISPAGWAVSMLIGFLVLLRAGALRRR
jgi:sterol desaturase/sphingolipid hydroxylase (fatty acid hydroxylase superfamily)